MFSVGDGTPVGDAQDDRLRLRAQETLQPSTCRRRVFGVAGSAAQPEKCVSEGDGVQEAPLVEPPTRCQTERLEDLPSGREPRHHKSKGTCAPVG